jgi:hypothetical protein
MKPQESSSKPQKPFEADKKKQVTTRGGYVRSICRARF